MSKRGSDLDLTAYALFLAAVTTPVSLGLTFLTGVSISLATLWGSAIGGFVTWFVHLGFGPRSPMRSLNPLLADPNRPAARFRMHQLAFAIVIVIAYRLLVIPLSPGTAFLIVLPSLAIAWLVLRLVRAKRRSQAHATALAP